MNYVKDGTLTIQARTIEEVNSIDRVVVYADGCQREYLMPLPTIEERKKGKWIDQGENLHKCSNCGQIIFSQTAYNLKEIHAFCGRCGARMKGE